MKEHVFTNLSRKTFLRGSLAAAVAASSASLLSACGGSAGGDSDKKVLRFGVNNPKVTFDTQKTSGSVGTTTRRPWALLLPTPLCLQPIPCCTPSGRLLPLSA